MTKPLPENEEGARVVTLPKEEVVARNGGPQSGRWYWCAARDVALGSDFADTSREAALQAERVSLHKER